MPQTKESSPQSLVEKAHTPQELLAGFVCFCAELKLPQVVMVSLCILFLSILSGSVLAQTDLPQQPADAESSMFFYLPIINNNAAGQYFMANLEISTKHNGLESWENCNGTFNNVYTDSSGKTHVLIQTAGECFVASADASINGQSTEIPAMKVLPWQGIQGVSFNKGEGWRCTENGSTGKNFAYVDVVIDGTAIKESQIQEIPVIENAGALPPHSFKTYPRPETAGTSFHVTGVITDTVTDGNSIDLFIGRPQQELHNENVCGSFSYEREYRGAPVFDTSTNEFSTSGVLIEMCEDDSVAALPEMMVASTAPTASIMPTQCDPFPIGSGVASSEQSTTGPQVNVTKQE